MKKLMLVVVLAAATCFAAEQKKKDAYDIRPAAAKAVEAPTATEWEKVHVAKIAELTKPEVLEGFLTSDVAAEGLLKEVKTGYATCPFKAVQIAAVSQYVMAPEPDACPFAFLAFWRTTRADKREIWATALLDAAKAAQEPDVTIFMLDQLRWCGCACQADEIEAFTRGGRKCVAEMGRLVAAELRAAQARED